MATTDCISPGYPQWSLAGTDQAGTLDFQASACPAQYPLPFLSPAASMPALGLPGGQSHGRLPPPPLEVPCPLAEDPAQPWSYPPPPTPALRKYDYSPLVFLNKDI